MASANKWNLRRATGRVLDRYEVCGKMSDYDLNEKKRIDYDSCD